ncbi:MAG TPA: hypothetical protein ENJ77_00360 [Candidatus Moranbacteria bacterium]|nr:hypothetical protein [Candidatus Moranbacteria bacterium]
MKLKVSGPLASCLLVFAADKSPVIARRKFLISDEAIQKPEVLIETESYWTASSSLRSSSQRQVLGFRERKAQAIQEIESFN